MAATCSSVARSLRVEGNLRNARNFATALAADGAAVTIFLLENADAREQVAARVARASTICKPASRARR